MTFEKVMAYYWKGNKIRRKSWNNPGFYVSLDSCAFCQKKIDEQDVLADDWQALVE